MTPGLVEFVEWSTGSLWHFVGTLILIEVASRGLTRVIRAARDAIWPTHLEGRPV